MGPKEVEPIQIHGYSPMHYAIVAVPSKSKKGTLKAEEAAIKKVQEDLGLEVHVMNSFFSRNQFLDGVQCEHWIVSYVRPEEKTCLASNG